jgi:hypothetical protein
MGKEITDKPEPNKKEYWESLGWKIEKADGTDGRWFAEKQFADIPETFHIGHIETWEELEILMQTAEQEFAKVSDGEQGLAVVEAKNKLSNFREEVVTLENSEVEEITDENVIDAELEDGEPKKPNAPHIFENLKVVLTKDQKELKTSELLQVMNTKDETISRFDSLRKSHQAEIKGYDKDIHRLRNVVDTGAEWKDVECEQRFDYARGIVDIFRIDTGAYVRSRQMKEGERQAQLFG